MKIKHSISGFSLLELSIVLVIIGLIAGSIVAGSSMIRAAELRAVITEHEQFNTAINTFRDKYLGLPGDLKNAVKFWGAAAGGTADGYDATCGALDHTSPSTGTETCNGNGNNWPQDSNVSTERYERFRAWQHLANAELISGSYTGVHGASGVYNHVPGENSPASKLSGATWAFNSNSTPITSSTNHYDATSNFKMELRNNDATGYQTITTKEAWNIDKKTDDGKPGQGKVGTYNTTLQPNCATTAVNATAEYNLTDDSPACSLIFFVTGSFQ